MTTRIHSPSGIRVIGPSLPLDMLLTVIPSLPRPVLARLTTHMIERMDELDGDPDLEQSYPNADGGRRSVIRGRGSYHEDDEDDDPGGGNIDDEPHDAEEDCCPAGDDRICSGSATGAMLLCEDALPGDADDAEPDGGKGARKPYRDATRQRSCRPRYYRAWGGRMEIDGYEFIREPAAPPARQLLRKPKKGKKP